MKTLQDYKKEYDGLEEKRNLSGKEALETVKQNGNDLVYVNEDMFEEEEDTIVLNGKKYKLIEN